MTQVLVVDDDEAFLAGLVRLLGKHGYEATGAEDVAAARTALAAQDFDLVLCDIRLPGGSGMDLVREISAQLPETAVVMVSGIDDPDVAREAIAIGAYGYVIKPFEPNEILINVINAVTRRDLASESRARTQELEEKILDRTRALREAITGLEHHKTDAASAEKATVDRLAKALAMRDEETGTHIERVSRYCEVIARRLGLEPAHVEELRLGSMLHDVGKIGVPDGILLKPGKLTEGEFDIVKRHAEMGHRLLLGSRSNILAVGAVVALTHHERWDGQGYPSGLSRDAIPIDGRIAAIADVFDALTSRRVYRDAYSVEEAIEIMTAERDGHFDPAVFDIFIDALDEITAIRTELVGVLPVMDRTIRVLLVDDHPMFLDSLVRIIGRESDMTVIGTAGSVAEAVATASSERPDVVILDWLLPDGTGARAATEIIEAGPETNIVVLTAHVEPSVVRAAIEAGCSGFLTKIDAAEEVVATVRAAFAGEMSIPTSLMLSVLDQGPEPVRGGRSPLTARETEVLQMLSHGYSNEALAEQLVLSVHTVRNHVQAAISKLGAHSKLEAVAIGAKRGIIRLGEPSAV